MAKKTTKKGTKVYVTASVQNEELSQAAFEGLAWVQVKKIGSIGDFGATSEINIYDTLDEAVSQKQKGTANAGDPVVECASVYDDPGQIILRDFADPLNLDMTAVKIERNDSPDGVLSNTIFYSRGIVSSLLYPGGGSNDFDLERFTLGLNQLPLRVDPE